MSKNVETHLPQSLAISKKKKAQYLMLLPVLSSELLNELDKILQEEQNFYQKIERKQQIERLALEKKFLLYIEEEFKRIMREAKDSQEAEEKTQAENILKELDTI